MHDSTENIIELMEFDPATGKRPPPVTANNRRYGMTSTSLYTYSLIIVAAILGLTLFVVAGVVALLLFA